MSVRDMTSVSPHPASRDKSAGSPRPAAKRGPSAAALFRALSHEMRAGFETMAAVINKQTQRIEELGLVVSAQAEILARQASPAAAPDESSGERSEESSGERSEESSGEWSGDDLSSSDDERVARELAEMYPAGCDEEVADIRLLGALPGKPPLHFRAGAPPARYDAVVQLVSAYRVVPQEYMDSMGFEVDRSGPRAQWTVAGVEADAC